MTASAIGARRISSPPCGRDLARRQPLLSRFSLYLIPAHADGGRARPVCLPENAAAGAREGARPRPADLLEVSPPGGRLEIPFPRRPASSSPIPPSRRSGIAAPISSTARATARSATAPAICSAPSSQASASPAVRIRKAATAGSPTLRQRGSAITRSGTSSASSKPATCRTAIRSVDRWRPWSAIRRSSRPRIAPRSRHYVKSLPPVEGPKHP